MISYDKCPACDSPDINYAFKVKDDSVSMEDFEIWHCNKCSLKFTQHVPDQNHIGPYYKSETYVSHSDSKKGLINTLYHIVRKKTLVSKRKLVERLTKLSNGEILDIGCGTGAFLNGMKESGWQTTGLEPDEVAIAKAKELYNLTPRPSTDLFKLNAASYDAISMWHVLEHVHELQAYILQIEKLLKPSGKIFIAVPNHVSYDAGVYKEKWAGYDVPRHLYHFNKESIVELLKKSNGLRLREIHPMWFDSFYVSMLSEQYKGGNILKAIFNGLISNLKAIGDISKCCSIIYVIEKGEG